MTKASSVSLSTESHCTRLPLARCWTRKLVPCPINNSSRQTRAASELKFTFFSDDRSMRSTSGVTRCCIFAGYQTLPCASALDAMPSWLSASISAIRLSGFCISILVCSAFSQASALMARMNVPMIFGVLLNNRSISVEFQCFSSAERLPRRAIYRRWCSSDSDLCLDFVNPGFLECSNLYNTACSSSCSVPASASSLAFKPTGTTV